MSKWLGWMLGLLFAVEAAAACPRIVSQAPYITDSLRWLGLESCVVGVSRYDTLERPRTGGVLDPDTVAIAALEPTLLLNADWIEKDVWQAAAPRGARAVRMQGFGSMQEIEANLRRLGELAAVPDAEEKAVAFGRDWRRAAQAVHGSGRALVVAGCGGQPYAFGEGTYLRDVFTAAGFRPAGNIKGVHQLSGGKALDDLIGGLQPQWVFLLQSGEPPHHCPTLTPRETTRLVPLDGELFFHPAPVLLKGLARLQAITREHRAGSMP